MSDLVETTESESWGFLLSKLRESGASGPQDEQSDILHSLLQHSLQLENRQSLTQDDVMMIVKLLSDWSEIYSSKSTPETPPKPGDPALLSLIKLLLNSCAGVPCNQHYLLEAGALAEISKLLLQFVTSHQQMPISTGDHRDVVVTATLQLLGNICVGFRDGRDKVWRKFFPQTLRSILRSFGQVEMVCMVLHNCTCTEDAKNRTREMVTSEGGLAILSHIVGAHEEKNCEWRSIFLRSFVDQMPLSELHRVLIPFQYGLWTALLETACQLMNHDQQSEVEVGGGKEAWPQWEEGECVYLVEMWRGEVGKVMSDQAAILIECFNTSSTEQLSSTAKMNASQYIIILFCWWTYLTNVGWSFDFSFEAAVLP
ncbi:hypothetical protein GBAR_LOCUS8506 [Geodia barretti]|uniref:Ataxin 10 n=1 Tax=Geodia barretti TaxID=519541 RepID=A0AA35RKX1_GEOBA|nr:hypothetical protein GBAR_LOCUS8506 [Geodia barretti]